MKTISKCTFIGFMMLISTQALGNNAPVAAFLAAPQTELGELKVNLDASASTDSDGTVASYSWNYGDSTTGSGATPSKVYSSPGTYAISLTVTDNLGATNTVSKNVIVKDTQAPILTFDNAVHSSNIFVKTLPASVGFSITSNEHLSNLYWRGEWFFIVSFPSWIFTENITSAGMKTMFIKGIDDWGNETDMSYAYWVIVDNDAPTIEVLPHKSLTNGSAIPLTILVSDAGPTSTQIKINGSLITTSTDKSISYSFPLSSGANNFEIKSTDAAGNISSATTFTVTKDSVAPTLSSLSPANSSTVDRISFGVSGSSSKALSEVYLNSTRLTLASGGLSFSGDYSAQSQGSHSLTWKAKDLAGNETTVSSSITIAPRLLIPELVSIQPDASQQHLLIIGAKGAARQGAEVSASEGLLSWNRASTVAAADGSFTLQMDFFSSATLKAEDTVLSQTDSTTLTYSRATTLSGIVKDSDDNPLPGVTVTLNGTSVTTNGSGVFSLSTPNTGDQTISFDGTTISSTVTGPNKKFSLVKMVINIGVGQSNVLPRPVYLTPLMLDGTETTISSSSAATVTSTHAPGVSLSVPAGKAVFPGGLSSGKINIQKIVASRSTVEVPRGAVPTNLIVLEPSGLSFTERVELTVPNDNELPAGVEMIFLSMNSEKGIWEVGGMGKVTSDGLSIKTNAGQGINHFSPYYAVPLSPQIFEVGPRSTAGINVADGAFTTKVDLPSYKIGQASVAPRLSYNSSWANPTAVVSNMIHVPEMKIEVAQDITSAYNQKLQYVVKTCVAGICSSDKETTMARVEITDHLQATSWYEPESIKSQFFIGGIATDELTFQNTSALSGDPSDLPGSQPAQAVSSNVVEYNGIPNQSLITYAVPLVKKNGSYLDTGVYPTVARYQIKLKNLTITTGYKSSKVTVDGIDPIYDDGASTTIEESRILDQVFPDDLQSTVLVQNKTNSEFGRGWKINGVQKILNPKSGSIVIEEEGGDLSTYVMDNTVVNLFNGVERDTSVDYGAVGLKQWPYAYVTKYDNLNKKNYLAKIDLTSQEVNYGAKSIAEISEIATGNGTAGNLGWGPSCGGGYSGNFDVTRHPYKFKGIFPVFFQTPSGSYVGISALEHYLFEYSSGTVTRLAGGGSGYNVFNPNVNMTTTAVNDQILTMTKWPGSTEVVSTHICLDSHPSNPSRNTLISSTGSYGSSSDFFMAGPFVGGSTSLLGINDPKDLVVAPDGSYIVTDYGNNSVKRFDPSSADASIILGTGSNLENYADGVGTSVPVYHPRGLVYDPNGNLYVSTGKGNIRVLRPDGTSSLIAGRALVDGGIAGDEAPALQMNFVDPYGLAFDKDHNFLYVADTGNNRVVRIDLNTGIASKVAGSGTCNLLGAQGKAALLEDLCAPNFISLDDKNNLIIVDAGSKKIKRVSFNFDQNSLQIFASTSKDLSKLVRNIDGTWSRIYRNGTQAQFDIDGRQTKSVDRLGKEINYSYDGDGRLSTVVDMFGQTTQYTYSSGRLSSITDPALRTTTFSYSGELLSSVNFPDGTSKRFEYDDNGQMIKEYNQRNIPTTYVYNPYNRIERVVLADGKAVEMNDFKSGSVSNSYTGGTVGTLKGGGFDSGKVSDSISNQNGATTSMVRSFNGYISRVQDAKGRVTSIERDLMGHPLKITDNDGRVTNYTYDPITFDVLSVEDVASGIVEYKVYDTFGNVVQKVNGKEKSTFYNYDSGTGLLMSSESAEGRFTSFTYYSNGLVQSKTLGTGGSAATWFYEYNTLGHLKKITSPDGKITEYVTDLAGNVTEVKNKTTSLVESITQHQYDSNNRLTKTISANGDATDYEYLLSGELSNIHNAKGKESVFNYNFLSQLISKSDETGATSYYAYDNVGNMINEIDQKGNLKKYQYDEVNNLTIATYPDEQIEYAYDSRNNVVEIKNATSIVTNTYNARGKLETTTSAGLGALLSYPSFTLTNLYDDAGNKTAMQSSYGNIAYTYDDDNKLTQIQNNWGDTFGIGYDNAQRITQISRPGSNSYFTYVGGGLPSVIQHKSGSAIKSYVEYDYDLRGFPTEKRSPAGTMTFGYDLNGQLTSVGGPGLASESYTYDSIGNRIADLLGTLSYDSASQRLLEDWKYMYYYDGNGNLAQKVPKDPTKNAFSYFYNSRNQLLQIKTFATPMGTLIKQVDYKYDVVGRRMQKSVWDSSATMDPKKTFTRSYVYDGQNIVFEFDGSTNLLAKYTHSPIRPDDVLGVTISSSGVTAGLSTSAGTAYYLKDAAGSISDLIDSSGNIIQRYQYDGFGGIVSIKDSSGVDITASPTVNSSYGFTGREFDKESELYYYRARYYDPKVGRFIQQDPEAGRVGAPITSTNKYTYAGNNPIVNTDPSGKEFFEDLWGYMVLGFASVANILIGIIRLDPSQILFGIALYVDLTLAPFGLLKNGKLPKYETYRGMPVVKNSVLADLSGRPGFSLGTGSFIAYNPDEAYVENVVRHEYGHYLQYLAWGGWEYLRIGWEQKGQQGSFLEHDADSRACKEFGNEGFTPGYSGMCQL